MVFWIFCKLNLLLYIRALLHKWRRQTVLKSGTGQSNLANYSRLSLHHTQRLPQGLAEQALDAQAELDGCVREGRTASALAARRAKPSHRIPGSSHIHRQRAARLPVRRAVLAPLSVLRIRRAVSLRASPRRFVQHSLGRTVTEHPQYFGCDDANSLQQIYRTDAQFNEFGENADGDILQMELRQDGWEVDIQMLGPHILCIMVVLPAEIDSVVL